MEQGWLTFGEDVDGMRTHRPDVARCLEEGFGHGDVVVAEVVH
jgi:hypothetical protein